MKSSSKTVVIEFSSLLSGCPERAIPNDVRASDSSGRGTCFAGHDHVSVSQSKSNALPDGPAPEGQRLKTAAPGLGSTPLGRAMPTPLGPRIPLPLGRLIPKPLVSVIMPAHNTEQFVGAAIASALNQTVAQIELIVVDDGSTDGTRAVIESWCRRDARVRLLANGVAQGSSPARNSGMAAARAPFFAFLDSDDEWLPAFLQVQLSAFDEYAGASVVSGNAVSVGGPLHGRPLRPVVRGRRRLSLLDMIEHEDSVNIMSVFRREVFDTIGGFDHGFCQSEDYDFWLRAATAGFVFVQTPEALVRYRRRPDGLSADELKMHAGIIAALTKALGRLEDRPAERAALERQIARFERQTLAVRAKTALRAREFATAATWFQALFERDRRPSRAALATLSRMAPSALWWADHLRRQLRRQPRQTLSGNGAPPR